MLQSAQHCWARSTGSRSDNATIIFALAPVPIVPGTAMGLEGGSAARKRTKRNAIADAAAISAVTPNMMGQTSAVTQLTATNRFIAQAASIAGLSLRPGDVAVTVTDKAGATGTQRTVSVANSGSSNDAVSALPNPPTLGIEPASASSAATDPTIAFSFLLGASHPTIGRPARPRSHRTQS